MKELMPEQMTHPEISTCPCCACESVMKHDLMKAGFDKFKCDTEVVLPERAVIHLGRACKTNMQIQAERAEYYGGHEAITSSPLNPRSIEYRINEMLN